MAICQAVIFIPETPEPVNLADLLPDIRRALTQAGANPPADLSLNNLTISIQLEATVPYLDEPPQPPSRCVRRPAIHIAYETDAPAPVR
ncbi:hypothetical protein ACPB9J_33670 [Streptomyces lavendulocolor]|uniref:hypothetical protein n=1 Tax=Streptomyces lavendulocolor TaxID=67316 RepID=UPI003C2ECB42